MNNSNTIYNHLQDVVPLPSGDSGKECNNDDEREPIAVLHIYPPEDITRAHCKHFSRDRDLNLLEDPISMCIVGGLRFKLDLFCDEHGKSHGKSTRYKIALGGLVVLTFIFAVLLRVRLGEDEFSQLGWGSFFIAIGIADTVLNPVLKKIHKTSALFLDSQRNFWHSWRESEIEHELSEMLDSCGYSFEIEEKTVSLFRVFSMFSSIDSEKAGSSFRVLSLYKKNGDLQITSLPNPKGDKTDKAEEKAKETWKIMQKLSFVERNAVVGDGDKDGEDASPNPLDLWTIMGICLGRSLIFIKTHKWTGHWLGFWATGLILGMIYLEKTFLLAFFVLWSFLTILASGIFNRVVNQPKYFAATEALCKRFSPLIHDRHEGYSLLYKIRPASRFGRLSRVLALEPPPADNGGMLA